MADKQFTLHIDGNRVFPETSVPDEITTVGQWADTVARENQVGGSDSDGNIFSFKVDGDVADRGTKCARLKDGALLELVDVTEFIPPETQVDLAAAGTDDDTAADEPAEVELVEGAPTEQ